LGSEHALVKRAYQDVESQGHSVDLQAMFSLVLGWEGVGGLDIWCATVEGLRYKITDQR